MGFVVVRLEEHGDGEMVELAKTIVDKEWRVRGNGKRIILSYGQSFSIEMDKETFKDLMTLGFVAWVPPEDDRLVDTLTEFCEWSGKDFFEFVVQAVFERLKADCEEIASYDVPKAREFAERLKGLSIS